MSSRIGIISFMVVSTCFFYSFFSKKTVSNDVFIRIENKTGYDFKEVLLGQRLIKKDSYKSTSYETSFDHVASNTKTEYENTRGKHIGYSRMRLSKLPSGYLNVPLPHIQQQIKTGHSFSDPFENPYSKNSMEGFSLEKGHYTFVVTEKDGHGNIDIIRDK